MLIWESGVGEWQPRVSQASGADKFLNSVFPYSFWWPLSTEVFINFTLTYEKGLPDLRLIQRKVGECDYQDCGSRLVAAILMHSWLCSIRFSSCFCSQITSFFQNIFCPLAWDCLHSPAVGLISFLDHSHSTEVPKVTPLSILLLLGYCKEILGIEVRWEI